MPNENSLLEIASRHSWEILPMPKWKTHLSFKRHFDENDFQKLVKGFIPKSMDDKWFIFFEKDWLHFHRSWTGFCIYQIKFAFDGQKPFIAESWANRKFNQHKNIFKSFDKLLLRILINQLLSN